MTTFILVQPEDVARMWTSAKLRKVLAENLKLWADTVDGELVDDELESPYIVINGLGSNQSRPMSIHS